MASKERLLISIYKAEDVKHNDYPKEAIEIYKNSIVYDFKSDDDFFEINFGSEDSFKELVEFYKDYLESEDINITYEAETNNKYSADGIIDEYEFDIVIRKAKGELAKYFESKAEITITYRDVLAELDPFESSFDLTNPKATLTSISGKVTKNT